MQRDNETLNLYDESLQRVNGTLYRYNEEAPLAVYILNNMTIQDRAEYDTYLRAFLGVFRKYQGEILAAVDRPEPIEGEWPYDRTILLRFPSREEALRWSESPEYQEIAQHRWNSTQSNVVILDEFAPPSDSRF